MLVLFMILNGLSTALFSGTLDALFIERYYALSDEGNCNLLQAQASFGIFSILGLAVGSLLAGFLPAWMQKWHMMYSLTGYYESNYAILIPLILLHILATKMVIKESATAKNSYSFRKTLSALGPFIKNTAGTLSASPLLLIMLLIDFLGGVAFISLEQLWQPRLAGIINDKDATWIFGLLFAINAIFMALGQGLSIPVSKLFKHHYMPMLVILELTLGALMIVLALQESLAGFTAAYCMLFVVSGLAAAPFMTMFHGAVTESQRSTMLSVKSLVTQAGAMVGAIAAGFLAGQFGIGLAWTVAGCLMFISAMFYFMPSISSFSTAMAQSIHDQNIPEAGKHEVMLDESL